MSDAGDERTEGARDFVISWRGSFEFERPDFGDPTPPFAEAFASRLAAARGRLAATESESGLAATARDGLARALEQLLCDLCAWPLQLLFMSSPRPGADAYDAFVARMCEDDLRELFDAYPHLAPLVEVAERSWLDAARELSRRLTTDSASLDRSFGAGQPLGRVLDVRAGLSDRHDGGRVVVALTFESGTRLFYKPRDVGLECEYNRLLDILNADGAPLPLRGLQVLERGGEYGWVEAAEARPCENEQQVRDYYRRAGMLTALWWVLDGTDLHRSNIVACGADPVLVDAETFFQSSAARGDGAAALQQLAVLPRLERDGDARVDISGLGGAARQRTSWRIPEWRRHGGDSTALCYRRAFLPRDRNAVLLDGKIQAVTSYSPELLEGFTEMHGVLADRARSLTADAGPLRALSRHTRRIVVRRTRDYFGALNVSLQPRNLRASVDPGRLLCGLLGAPPVTPPGLSRRQVLDREVRALRRLDIPRFVIDSPGDGRDPAWEATCERLRNKGISDLESCLSEIRKTLATRILDRSGPPTD